jgi:aminocarboxymuconate-semialdehyde decarboxylase
MAAAASSSNVGIKPIDVHTHGFPEEILRRFAIKYPDDFRLEQRRNGDLVAVWSGVGVPLPAWIAEERLAAIERDQVELEILSAPTPVYAKADHETVHFCELINEFQAEVAIKYPNRFRSFIHLPVNDPKATRSILERWKNHPMTAGIVLGSNLGGIYPGDSSMVAVWEEIAASNLAVFIHPLGPCGVPGPLPAVVFDFVNDTARAAATIIYSGLLDRFPELRIILAHLGGSLPYHLLRLDFVLHPHFPQTPAAKLKRRPSEYAGHFFIETAQGFHRPSFACAREVFGFERILYGSDHFLLDSPFRPDLNKFIETLALSSKDREAIMRGNARRVLRGV